tara:strand:- start:1119 stop:3515 length:2397 start_codon:yes stop_codon:yes gene_type:complete
MALFDTIRGGASGAKDYEVARSVRFNGETDDAYFKRTSVSSPTNVKIWTMSLWIKRDAIVNGNDMEMLFGNDYYTGSISTRGFQFAVGRNDFKFETFDGASSMGTNTSAGDYRDPTAWMHIVVQCDTTQSTQSNRMRVYTNGTDIGMGNSIGQNQELTWNKGSRVQYLGCHDINGGATRFYRGYIAEAHFVDGQSLDPSNFAETDDVTGFYKPIEYSGTYGNNGWYMAFTDNSGTTATTLGKDYSGNGNNMTPFNFSVSSGIENDSVLDTPTNNWCTLNPTAMIAGGNVTPINGNLSANFGTVSGGGGIGSNIVVRSGKWYWETTVTAASGAAIHIGILDERIEDFVGTPFYEPGVTSSSFSYQNNGTKYNNNTNTSYGASYTTNDVIGTKLDLDNGTIEFLKNNSSQGTAFTGLTGGFTPAFGDGSSAGTHSISVNFGQQGFTYSIPTGYKALNSQNLPEPTIPKGDKYFDAITYSGTGSQRAVQGFNFAPDWVWVKRRNNNNFHILANTILGAGNYMVTNTVDAESSGGSQLINGFNTDGFDVGTEAAVNNSSGTYVAWCWNAGGSTATNSTGTISASVRASATSGFSIISYTGNGTSGATVGHGLGVKPSFFIIKQRNGTGNWVTYDRFNGATKHFTFTSNASSSYSGLFNDTEPTSSVLSVGNDVAVNVSSNPYICYCFAEVFGFSKFGIFHGNGNADGAFIYCGFRPRYVVIKRSDSGNHWVIYDAARSTTNVIDDFLKIETQDSESTTSQVNIDFCAVGFKMRSAFDIVNAGSGEYFFFAFAENAFKYARAR